MPTPDQVRELVASADQRWETLEVEGRTWQDRIIARDAATAMRRERGAGALRTVRGDIPVPSGEREQSWHLWRGGEVLVRSEYEIGRELVTVVGQGPRWWRWSPTLGPTSGGGVGRPVRLMLGPPGLLLGLKDLVDQLAFTRVRDTSVTGRRALIFQAKPNASRPRGRAALREAGSGADEYELSVDAERGVLLRLVATRGGTTFQRVETTRITYDEALAPSLFTPDRSDPGRLAPARAAQHVSGAEVAASVDFRLLAPLPSPSPVAPHVSVFDGDRRGLGPRHVVFAYVVVDPNGGRGQLRVTEAASPLPRRATDEWTSYDDLEICEERHGRVERRRVRAERDGVYVELDSAVLPLGRLVELARSLAPVEPAG